LDFFIVKNSVPVCGAEIFIRAQKRFVEVTMEKEKKISENRKAKEAEVEVIKAKIQESKSVVLASYNKLTVLEVTDLRNRFRNASCEYKVYKNTLVRKAFNELGVTDFDGDLNGATAFVFCPDETSGCSIIAKAVKENPALDEKLVPKSAYVGGAYVDAAGVKRLAAIPSREVLIAKMLGCLQAPIANLAYVLNAIAGQKS
jgi:large subunit ribosomal protein L10